MAEKKSEEGYLQIDGDEYQGQYHVLLSNDRKSDFLWPLFDDFVDTGKRVRITIEELED